MISMLLLYDDYMSALILILPSEVSFAGFGFAFSFMCSLWGEP